MLLADSGQLTSSAPSLQSAASAATLAGQTAQNAYESASGSVGAANLEAAIDGLGGVATAAHDIVGGALQALGDLASAAGVTYSDTDRGLATSATTLTCPANAGAQ